MPNHGRLGLGCFVLFAVATAVPAQAPAQIPSPSAATGPWSGDLARGRSLLAEGRPGEARKDFERADHLAQGRCGECLAAWIRSSLALGRAGEAAGLARALTDLHRATEGGLDLALLEAALVAFQESAGPTAAPPPDLYWGEIDLLAALGRGEAIVTLARERLAAGGPPLQAAVCAAEHRPSLAERPGELPLGAAINEGLAALGWEGPYLVAGRVAAPAARHQAHRETTSKKGVRAVAVLDRRGSLAALRAVGREPHERALATSGLHASTFDPATLAGRRVAVCHPFVLGDKPVGGAGRPRTAAGARRPAGEAAAPGVPVPLEPGLFEAFQKLESAEAVAALIAEHGLAQADAGSRSAVCGVREALTPEVLTGLIARDWPGPFPLGAELTPPQKENAPPPRYTEQARKDRVQGIVVVVAVVDDQGRVQPVAVSRDLPPLTDAALDAVERWEFEPARLGGRPVAACYALTVSFQLQ